MATTERVGFCPIAQQSPSSSPPSTDPPSQDRILRNADNRCIALLRFATSGTMALEGFVLEPSVFEPLPEAFHDEILPVRVGAVASPWAVASLPTQPCSEQGSCRVRAHPAKLAGSWRGLASHDDPGRCDAGTGDLDGGVIPQGRRALLTCDSDGGLFDIDRPG
jgi:hypothetical protein